MNTEADIQILQPQTKEPLVPQEARRGKEGPFLEPSEGKMPGYQLDCRLAVRNCEKINFYYFRPLSL